VRDPSRADAIPGAESEVEEMTFVHEEEEKEDSPLSHVCVVGVAVAVVVVVEGRVSE